MIVTDRNRILCFCTIEMTGQRCVVSGNTTKRDPNCSFHHFPSDSSRKNRWLEVFGIEEDFILLKPSSHVCARHFPGGDITKEPQANWVNGLLLPLKRNYQEQKGQGTEKVLKA